MELYCGIDLHSTNGVYGIINELWAKYSVGSLITKHLWLFMI